MNEYKYFHPAYKIQVFFSSYYTLEESDIARLVDLFVEDKKKELLESWQKKNEGTILSEDDIEKKKNELFIEYFPPFSEPRLIFSAILLKARD